jgi:predicted transcriptional regulator
MHEDNTITITLDDSTAQRLRSLAERSNIGDLNRFAVVLLNEALDRGEGGVVSADEATEIEVALAVAVEDERAGRVKSMAQVVEETRTKFGLPDNWPSGSN